MPVWLGPNPKAQASGPRAAGSFPNTYAQCQGQTPLTSFVFCPVSFPKLQKGVPNSQTICGPGEGDENVNGPSLRFRGSPATSSSLELTRHRAWVITKGHLFPRAIPHFLEGSP